MEVKSQAIQVQGEVRSKKSPKFAQTFTAELLDFPPIRMTSSKKVIVTTRKSPTCSHFVYTEASNHKPKVLRATQGAQTRRQARISGRPQLKKPEKKSLRGHHQQARKQPAQVLSTEESSEEEQSNDEDSEFCLEQAIEKLASLAEVGMSYDEFTKVFVPKRGGNCFSQFFYLRMYEKYLEKF